MPAVAAPPVRAKQTLTFPQARDEARAAFEDSGDSQTKAAALIGTTQSAVSAALNASDEEASNHGAVYQRLIAQYTPYRLNIERTVSIRVERKEA